MNLPPRDYTAQENIIADYLSEFGLRYIEQYDLHPYTADFFIPELNMVIEADGKYGHLKKRDHKRDQFLLEQDEVEHIIHIKETTKVKIKDVLWQELNKLPLEANPEQL
tara:strand:- start:1121 stop:1447 length:327 start_codon:yes stop_codon:yes gene_type:complete